MKTNILSVDILNQIKQRLINDQKKIRYFSNQSYQEYQFYNHDHLHCQYINALISLLNNGDIKSNFLSNIAENHNKYHSSLLSHCNQIDQIIDQSSIFTFSHKSFLSQSCLLAYYLAKITKNQVAFIVADSTLLSSSHLVARQAEDDKISFTKNCLNKQGITLYNLKDWISEPINLKKQQIIVIDCFNLNPTDYTPFIIKHFQNISITNKMFIYHSHLQDQQISQFLSTISIDSLALSSHNNYPTEYTTEPNEKKVIDQLIDFLQEDINHPQKQDVIIFYPVDQHIRRYSSKLNQNFSKNGLKQQVNIFIKPHLPQSKFKNSIFIVEGIDQLLSWNYDYSKVLYVIDYGKQIKFTFSYEHHAFVRAVRQNSNIEKSKRMSIVGMNRIGRYVCLSNQLYQVQSHLDQVKQLSIYLLKMIDFGLLKYVDRSNKRISQCLSFLQSLEILKKDGDAYKITDQRIIQAAKHQISAVQSKLIYSILDDSTYDDQAKKRLANLMVMTLVVSHNQSNLRQAKQEVEAAAHIKPNGIWRKTGYIDSCLDILTKCQLIDLRKSANNQKSETFRRKTSKANEYEYDVFGCLFEQQTKKKKTFQEMQIPDLIRQYTVSQDLLNTFREHIDDYRDVFGIEQTAIIFDKQDIINIVSLYLNYHKKATALYSGSRRNGYQLNSSSTCIFPDKTSLISQLNERSEFIAIFRLSYHDNSLQILIGNSFNADTYLSVYGHLPVKKTQSLSEIQVQFHGITSSLFQKLWKNNGAEIIKFETQNDCYVQPNEQMALIIIHCLKQKSEQTQSKFELVLTKIRQKLSVSNKLVHYLGNTNLILGAGGSVKQIVKSDYINKCLLSNLHLDITKQDLQQLFEELVTYKDIIVNEPQNGKFYKSAIIIFNTQRQYYLFYDTFKQCIYYDRVMDIKPLKDDISNQIKAQQYIQFRWFVWKSHRKALITFTDPAGAKKAVQAFKLNPELDGVKVNIIYQELSNKVIIDQLKGTTDQIYIQEALKNYGEIKDLQILKTPLKQITGEDSLLENLIKAVLIQQAPANQNQNFKLGQIQKKRNGLRVCRVMVPNINMMNLLANKLNKQIGKMGQGRIYAQTWFEIPTLVPHNSMSIYQQLLDETLKAHEQLNVQYFIKQDRKKTYIILKSGIKQTLDVFYQKFTSSLLGFPLFLTDYEKSIILTDIGLANILDIQQKYHCKLIINVQNKILNILCKEQKLKQIKEQVKSRVDDHFFYRITLNSKAFKYFKTNKQKIEQIKFNYSLSLIDLEIDSKALLLQGSALNVQKAFNFLMHIIESLTVPQQLLLNADVCGICCEEPHRPYRLQNCSHKFCRDCLLQCVNSALGDASLFPLKCPQCFKQIVIDDLQLLLEANHWAKVQTMATNQYVAKKAEVMTFCYTPGCKQINMIKSNSVECDICMSNYCIQCKMRYHPGLTCAEAKQGGDELFKKYMKQNGIRQCPNKTCKIPVVRIDGCYRVTCSRCNKSMCFKCEPEQMIAYDNYDLCYQHLNQVHGGYW